MSILDMLEDLDGLIGDFQARNRQRAAAGKQGMTPEQMQQSVGAAQESAELGNLEKRQGLEHEAAAEGRRVTDADMASRDKIIELADQGYTFSDPEFAEMERLGMGDQAIADMVARSNYGQHMASTERQQAEADVASTQRGTSRGDIGTIIDAAEMGVGLEDTPEGLAMADEDASALVERARRDDTQSQQDRLQKRELIDARIKSLEQSGQLSGMTPSQVNQVMKTLMQADSENIFGRALTEVSDQELMEAIQRIMGASRESAFR